LKDLVSIVTPAYNCSEFIGNTIESVQNQTYTHWEMIVVDDCSSDETYKIIKRAAEADSRIKLIQNSKNEGPAVSRNRAIKEAKGNYIAFLDGDDCWAPNKLETQLTFMQKNGAMLSHSSYMLVGENGKRLGRRSVSPMKIGYKELIQFNWIGTSTVIYNCSELGKHFMYDIQNRQDWACWLQLVKKTDAYFIDIPLVKYRVRKGSISGNKFKLVKYHWKIYREIEEFSWVKSVFYLVQNLMMHLRNPKIMKIE